MPPDMDARNLGLWERLIWSVTVASMAVTVPTDAPRAERAAVPITERLLPPRGRSRWLVIAAWCSIPLVRLLIFAPMLAAAGLVEAPMDVFQAHFFGAVLNAYVLLIVLLGIRPVTQRLRQVAALGNEQTERVARLNGSRVGPLMLLLVLTVLGEISLVTEYGGQAIAQAPIAFAVEFLFALVIRLPQSVALWTSVVALATVAELGRHPVPGTFPEDRSLGLRKIGTMLTTILLFYAAILIPAFIFATSQLPNLLTVIGIALLGLAAMLVAVWQIHRRMVAERAHEVEAATARYAAAYRQAAADPSADANSNFQSAQLMLEGARSIHEWPFDDRTERIAGLLLTSVLAGVIVRLVLIGLGF